MSSASIKPYRFQVLDNNWPDDTEVDEWADSLNAPIFNMMIGPAKCGKTTFINNYGPQSRGSKATVSGGIQNVTDSTSEINIVDGHWLDDDLYECIMNEEAVIVDQDNLTRKDREKTLSKFPSNYWKVAIIWELSDDELRQRGCGEIEIEEKDIKYERPDSDEGFDELVYIFS